VESNGVSVAPLVPETVLELAASCVRFVHASVGVELDFTSDTLPLLDHYAAVAREDLKGRPEAWPLLAQSMGAYFGQVVAAELTGFWRAVESNPDRWLLCLQPVFLAINPVGIAHEIIAASDKHDGPSAEFRLAREDRELVASRLASLPEVPDTDYYTFSTRFDAIQIVAAALKEQMHEGGIEDVTFDLSDYQDELGDI
jgi:hypothetical protein